MRMTPHLLHTRSFLILPPSSKPHPSLKLDSAEEKAREDKLVREEVTDADKSRLAGRKSLCSSGRR